MRRLGGAPYKQTFEKQAGLKFASLPSFPLKLALVGACLKQVIARKFPALARQGCPILGSRLMTSAGQGDMSLSFLNQKRLAKLLRS